jgi:hypothetical protein
VQFTRGDEELIPLMSVLSACVIHEQFGLGWKAADNAGFEEKVSYSQPIRKALMRYPEEVAPFCP